MSELISGKEALKALANGGDVEFKNPFQNFWVDIKSLTITEIEGGYYVCSDDGTKVKTQFRRKPRTITLNGIEVPAPFKPSGDEEYWSLEPCEECGYSMGMNVNHESLQFGAWRTEEEIRQVVEALRSIFNAN